MSFAAPGEISALSLQFAAMADPLTLFGEGSFKLSSAARANLGAQALWLTSHPDVAVHIVAGAGRGDRELAARRARTVEAALIDGGVDRSRIRLTIAAELAGDGELDLASAVLTEVVEKKRRAPAAPVLPPVPVGAVVATATPTPAAPATSPAADVPVGEVPVATAPEAEEPVAALPVAPNKKPKRPNAGKGNGGEETDPGNSALHNNAGDD